MAAYPVSLALKMGSSGTHFSAHSFLNLSAHSRIRLRHSVISRIGGRQYSSATATDALFRGPPRPSRFRRILFGTAVVFVSFTAGVMATVAPAYPIVKGLLYPPSDAATLSLFRAEDDMTERVNSYITTHPVAVELRSRPNWTESRPHLKIPDSVREHSLTGGTLAGPGRIWVPPLFFSENGGQASIVLYYLGGDVCGHPDVVHGGLIATILDEGLARCCFAALPNKIGMTANLNIDYRKPLPTNTYVVLRAETVKVEGRKAWVEGRLETLVKDGEKPTIYAEAKALFIEPKHATSMMKLISATAS